MGGERWTQTSGDRPQSIDSQERGSSSKRKTKEKKALTARPEERTGRAAEQEQNSSLGSERRWHCPKGRCPPASPLARGDTRPGRGSQPVVLGWDGWQGGGSGGHGLGKASCQCPVCRGLCSQRYSCRKCSSVIS